MADVSVFLEKFPILKQYVCKFKEEDIDGTMLLHLIQHNPEDLWKYLGVKIPHRYKIKIHFEEFCKTSSN